MSDGLQRIKIKGFRSLADIEFEPGRLTVLIGANGVGKSNLLQVLRMVPQLRTKSLQTFVTRAGGASALLHYGPSQTEEVSIELEFLQEGRRNGYRARLGYAAGDKLYYVEEAVDYQPASGGRPHTTTLESGHWESNLEKAKGGDVTARTVDHLLSRLTFYHFHDTSMTSPLRSNSRSVDDRYLRSDGGNLASYLARLEQSSDESEQTAWRRINQFVRRVAPSVKALCPTAIEGGRAGVRLDWLDDRDERFGCHHFSDGTLRAIALITVLAQPTKSLPSFMSIDEPELGLHPAAIHLLAELARSVSRHTQVLFATQSTAFLDHFAADEVAVVERVDGASEIKKLDTDALQGWLEDYSLSEVFDKGVIGGRP